MRPSRVRLVMITAAASALAAAHAQAPLTLASPDHRTQFEISTSHGLSYRVIRDGSALIATSPIGMVTSRGAFGAADSNLVSSDQRADRKSVV